MVGGATLCACARVRVEGCEGAGLAYRRSASTRATAPPLPDPLVAALVEEVARSWLAPGLRRSGVDAVLGSGVDTSCRTTQGVPAGLALARLPLPGWDGAAAFGAGAASTCRGEALRLRSPDVLSRCCWPASVMRAHVPYRLRPVTHSPWRSSTRASSSSRPRLLPRAFSVSSWLSVRRISCAYARRCGRSPSGRGGHSAGMASCA